MNEFIDAAEGLRKQHGEARGDFDLVFTAIGELQAVHSKARIENVDNMEYLFAAFEMAKLLGRLGEMSPEDVQQLPDEMKRMIQQTLEMTILFPIRDHSFIPPKPYDSFQHLIQKLVPQYGHDPRGDVSIITFNYDLCLDLALPRIDYCLDNSTGGDVKLLKLHGSLNWGYCEGCGKIVAWDLDRFLGRRLLLDAETTSAPLRVASRMGEFKHCGSTHVQGPFIVPPTWNKMQHHGMLGMVWRTAASELANAEDIFVCGYSLPDTDQFFRYLYALGSVGETRVKRFWVFDPEEKVADRFRELLGPTVQNRFEFHKKKFSEAVNSLTDLLVGKHRAG